jgi:hypothetical protein
MAFLCLLRHIYFEDAQTKKSFRINFIFTLNVDTDIGVNGLGEIGASTSGEMQPASHFVMLVPTYQTTQHHKPVNYTLNICYFEKLRSHLLSTNSYAGKGKGHPITGHKGPRGGNRGYSSTHSQPRR